MKGSKLGIRLLYYFGGFFVMTIGIALSVKMCIRDRFRTIEVHYGFSQTNERLFCADLPAE